jgi:two-component system, OmpR family, phosphate regulon sensor histidine kinase PhoR
LNKKFIIFIIIITSFSLAGIVSMQLFWVRNAIRLQEQQLDHRISIALKSVINQLGDENTDSINEYNSCSPGCGLQSGIISVVNPQRLDSILKEEFVNLNIDLEYKYGVFRKPDNKFLMGDYINFEKEIIASTHSTSLSCLMKQECYILSVYFPDEKNYLTRQMIWWLVLSAFFLLIVIISFSYVIMNLFRQKKLSEMKTDFVNNMTHEFKTPIATISLASEMLLKPNVHESADKTVKYANIIYDENSRLKNQVEQVLQIAVLDRGTFKLKKQELQLHYLITEAAENFEMQVKQREGKLTLDLNAKTDTLQADPIHLINIIHNLLDNANKYSPENPDITIRTWNVPKGIMISVEDKGIGISHENQRHVFKKFYRVHTGNIHDVKGFGLGLYYVKTIIEAHDGDISLHSELKKGTRFEIFLPIVQK